MATRVVPRKVKTIRLWINISRGVFLLSLMKLKDAIHKKKRKKEVEEHEKRRH